MDLRKVKDEAAKAFTKGKFAKAAELYAQYCQGDPKDLQARLRMGDSFAKAGEKTQAIASYKAAAEGFARDGFLPRAIAASKLILELDPKHTGVQQMLAGLYAAKGGGPGTPKPAARASFDNAAPARTPGAPAPASDWSTRADAIELPSEEPDASPGESAAAQSSGGAVFELDLDGPVDHSDELPPELALRAPGSIAPESPSAAPAVIEIEEVEELVDEEPIALDRPKSRPVEPPAPAAPPRGFSPPAPGPASSAFGSPAPSASPSGFAPPGLRPKRASPELESPPASAAVAGPQPGSTGAFKPSGRIWIPGSASEVAPVASAPAPSAPVPAPVANTLDRLSRFDELDLEPSAPEPELAPIVVSHSISSFTELELDGDSLLHAVSLAAQSGAVERAQRGQATVADVQSLRGEEVTSVDPIDPSGLPKIPLFSDLPPEAFIALFERCPLVRPAVGETIIEQGSLGDSFFVICEGSVRVVRVDGGQRRELATLKDGAFFGEMALLSGAARTASVESAEDDTQLLEISGALLKELSAMYPQVAQALKKFMRQRLLSNVMGSSPLFTPFSKKDRRALVERFRSREVKKGDPIIREGDRSDGLYIVLSGEVSVRKAGMELARLKEGELFGEMSLLQKTPASATVSAAKNTTVLRLPREDFDALVSTNPEVHALVSELTANRARANELLLKTDAEGDDIMF